MISLNVHNIKEIKVGKTHRVFKEGSYAKTIRIETDEVTMEITLFADKSKNLVEVRK